MSDFDVWTFNSPPTLKQKPDTMSALTPNWEAHWAYVQSLEEKAERFADLEAENAALWAYARACIDLFESPPDGPTGIGVSPTQRILTARKALRQWEDNDE